MNISIFLNMHPLPKASQRGILNVTFWRYRYPSRLIDLGEATDKNDRVRSDEVRLISTAGLLSNGPVEDRFYVTLSHCWGQAKFTTLTEQNLSQFLGRGIKINTLPRTFRDAIYFARRLSKQVRYLWIDSLCIIQGKSEAQYTDWLRESSQMYLIYRNSYCNISATAATDSERGLFFGRKPRELWEDDINLNVEVSSTFSDSYLFLLCCILRHIAAELHLACLRLIITWRYSLLPDYFSKSGY